MDIVSYVLAKKYTDNSILGISGALAGKNCKIQSITPIDGGNRVTFSWTADDGTSKTSTMDVKDGVTPIANVVKDGNTVTITIEDAAGETTATLKDGVDGKDGTDGEDAVSPEITVKESTNTRYVLHIKTADDEFDTPNLKGGGGEGGTSDYEDLENKPKIGGVELSGDKSATDLGLVTSETGKGLSTNDYTTEERDKLAGIAVGAEVNVQADWDQTDSAEDDYIKNKPTLGTAAGKDYTTSITEDSTDLVTSGAVHAGLDEKIDASEKGAANGVAQLDSTGKVPSAQLPSYVDDVLAYDSLSDFPEEGETGKIYVTLDENKTYRWSGSDYVEISESIALGETSSTAYPGDKGKQNADDIAGLKEDKANKSDLGTAAAKDSTSTLSERNTNLIESGSVYTALSKKIDTSLSGAANGVAPLDSAAKIPVTFMPDGSMLSLGTTATTAYYGDKGKTAYDHSQKTSGNPHNVTKADVGLGNVDNTADEDKPISTATQTALDLKQPKTLSASKSIGTTTATTVEAAINAVSTITPTTASSANKLLTAEDIGKVTDTQWTSITKILA